MLYTILDNGDFVGVVEGPDDAPVLDYLSGFGEASDRFIHWLISDKGFERVSYNVSDDTQDSNPGPRPTPSYEHELYVFLTDDSLWGIVHGDPGREMAKLIEEFNDETEVGELEEYLSTKGFARVTHRVVDGIDAFGPMRYADGVGVRVKHRVHLN